MTRGASVRTSFWTCVIVLVLSPSTAVCQTCPIKSASGRDVLSRRQRHPPRSSLFQHGQCTTLTLHPDANGNPGGGVTARLRIAMLASIHLTSQPSDQGESTCRGLTWKGAQQVAIVKAAIERRSERLGRDLNNASLPAEQYALANNDTANRFEWLDMEVHDTCGAYDGLVDAAKGFSERSSTDMLWKRFEELGEYDLNCQYDSCYGSIPAVLGPATDSGVAASSQMLYAGSFPHVSHWSSGDVRKLTGRPEGNPLLFRTLPPDSEQVRLMVDFAVDHEWKFVMFIHSASEAYGRDAFEAFKSAAERRKAELCVAANSAISWHNMSSLEYTAELLSSMPKAVAVIVYADHKDADTLFTHLHRFNSSLLERRMWLISNDYASFLQENNQPALQNSAFLLVQPWTDWHLSAEDVTFYRAALEKMMKLKWEDLKLSNPLVTYIARLIEQEHNCTFTGRVWPSECEPVRSDEQHTSPPCTQRHWLRTLSSINQRKRPISAQMRALVSSTERVLDVVERSLKHRLAHVRELDGYDCPVLLPGREVKRELEAEEGRCPSGERCNIFTTKQSGQPIFNISTLDYRTSPPTERVFLTWSVVSKGPPSVSYVDRTAVELPAFRKLSQALSVQQTNNSIPSSICSAPCLPGTRRALSSFSLCCWRCERCTENSFTNETNARSCTTCPVGMLANVTHGCLPLAAEYLKLGSGWGVAMMVLGSICLVVVALSIGYYYYHQHDKMIRAGDFKVSMSIQFCLIVSLSTVPVVLWKPSDGQCRASYLLFFPPIWFSMTLLLWKVARLADVVGMTKRLRHARESRVFSPWMHLVWATLSTIVGLLLSGYGYFLDPPKLQFKHPRFDQRLATCRWFSRYTVAPVGYTVLLLLTASAYAFRSRALPAEFNEARLVWMATSISCLAWGGLMPTFATDLNTLQPVILAWLIVFYNAILWGCLFLPRIFSSIWGREEDTMSRISRPTMSTMCSRATMVVSPSLALFHSASQSNIGSTAISSAKNDISAGTSANSNADPLPSVASEDWILDDMSCRLATTVPSITEESLPGLSSACAE